MRNIQAAAIFIFCIVGALSMVVYARGEEIPKWEAQNRHRVDLQHTSQWFKGQKYGEACYTWMTCTHKGARIRGVFLDQAGNRMALGRVDKSVHFLDTSGKTPLGMVFEACEGGHNGLSVRVQSQTNQADPSEILVRIASSREDLVDTFVYTLPSGYNPELESDVILIFEAETGGVWQVYEQHSSMQGCSS